MHRRRQLLGQDPGRSDREPTGEAARGLRKVQVGHQDHLLPDVLRRRLARLARAHHGALLAADGGEVPPVEIERKTDEATKFEL